ncbi:hypothetical protein ACVWZ6_001709 [Bradyrhizobium sp. GM6.1]
MILPRELNLLEERSCRDKDQSTKRSPFWNKWVFGPEPSDLPLLSDPLPIVDGGLSEHPLFP